MKKVITTALLVAGLAVGVTACDTSQPGTHADKVVADQKAQGVKAKAASDKPEVEMTTAQEQATASAADYLDYSAFSKSGLVDQLKYEDFSAKDATFAVNHITVDWNKQAAASAADYLDYDSFSRQGLIDQLVYEGFTTKQATYGVNQTGL